MKTKDIFHHMQEDERGLLLLEAFWEEGAQSLMGGRWGEGRCSWNAFPAHSAQTKSS